MTLDSSKKKRVTLKDLYPDLGPEDLQRLDEWYEGYAELILRIFERIEQEKMSKS
jgi:hypothetical protein